MNICMFTNTYLPHVGGVARSVWAFSTDLKQRGHRVLVVAPEFPQADEADRGGLEVLRVPAIQNFSGSDFSVRIAVPFVINEAIDTFEPDVIHSHHPFLLGDAALRAARRRRKPLIFTHHTLYERYTHYVPMDSPAMKRFVIHLSTEYANLCHAVVAPSRSVAGLIRERGVRTHVEEIPTGVDLAFFEEGDGEAFRNGHGIPREAPVIGHVGRLAPEKNLDYLTEAAARCLEEREDLRFVVVGDGPSLERIREGFRRRGLSDRLVAPGSMTGRALSNAYAAMDLFVFSSTSETQGMVLAEAMAAGTPVIALDASGSREVVEDRRNGRLLPEESSAEDFAGAALELLSDREILDKTRERALDTARSLSRESCAALLETLYQAVLGGETRETSPHEAPVESWETLLGAITAEWELITQKTAAAMQSFQSEGSESEQE
jgi:glycosyltransferase involved in cell wall biosynthesis